MNQEVTEYIQQLNQPWQVEVCNHIHQLVHQAIPEVTERIQYGKPHYLKNSKYVCVLSPAKGWVSFTLFNVTTREGFFEPGGSPDRKTIKIRQGQDVDYGLLAKLLQQAAASH